MLRMVLGQDVVTAEDRDTAYYPRITLIVRLALTLGIVLQRRIDATPARMAYGVAYLTGGWRIALDSWAELRHRRLSIDFLMGAAAVGGAGGSPRGRDPDLPLPHCPRRSRRTRWGARVTRSRG